MPDRLPTLVLLVGVWVPPAAFGCSAAALVHCRAFWRFATVGGH
jgi:hypothetical protein